MMARRTQNQRPAALESSLVSAIIRALRALPGVVVRKRHGSAWGTAGDPDLYGTVNGRHFEIEVKRPGGGTLTPLQEVRLQEWAAAGALTGVARSVEDALQIIRGEGGIHGRRSAQHRSHP
mgnify:FL=1